MIAGLTRNPYAPCFHEIDAAVSALRNTSTPPVVFNAHAYPDEVPDRAIVFNLENVGVQVHPHMFDAFRKNQSCEIWDFSQRNIERLNEGGVHVTHVAIGYHPSMERFTPLPYEEKTIDVVFAGAINDRRREVLHDLKRRGLNVCVVPDLLYGAARDALFARSKLALNMLYYSNGVFPSLRAAHLVANKVPLLSECCPEGWDFIPTCTYEEIADRAEALVRRRREYLDHQTESSYVSFRMRPLVLPS